MRLGGYIYISGSEGRGEGRRGVRDEMEEERGG
jgi:hypothetical protein